MVFESENKEICMKNDEFSNNNLHNHPNNCQNYIQNLRSTLPKIAYIDRRKQYISAQKTIPNFFVLNTASNRWYLNSNGSCYFLRKFGSIIMHKMLPILCGQPKDSFQLMCPCDMSPVIFPELLCVLCY